MLEKINSPKDIKGLSQKELSVLANDIRKKITLTVSRNGGHLASNLGIVETVIAIHKVFDTPRDAVVFDVGHQCYAHKLITGRYTDFDSLRSDGGISGFVNSDESPFDIFTEGHSGTSLSQALGLTAAANIQNTPRYVIAVIGDGSFTNGMIFEALNNCKSIGKRLIIILNDNEMSISKNIGGLSNHLTKIRTSKKYFAIKHRIKKNFSRIPFIGSPLTEFAKKLRNTVRRVLVSDNLFECMGIDYIGTVDGNDISKMQTVLEEAKAKAGCTLVHIHTKKGKGYLPAERNPEKYHSTGKFDIEKGALPSTTKKTFSSVFGETMRELALENSKICAVTAAMEEGVGLLPFKQQFPDRFFDVGIAEEHAVTFAAGLSKGKMIPICAMYSTFSQRVYDQLSHDAAIQKLPFILCLDRAGIVEGDGITHQGIFDVSEFCGIPGINIFSPETYSELREALRDAVHENKLCIIRYPRGSESEYDRQDFHDFGSYCRSVFGSEDADTVLITYGRICAKGFAAARAFYEETGKSIKIIKLKKIFPLENSLIETELKGASFVYILEEGIKSGGIGEKISSAISEAGLFIKTKIHAAEGFISHGTLSVLFEDLGFTEKIIKDELCGLSSAESRKEGAYK